MIELAKEKPGEITYAATGRGRLTHLTMELFQARTGTKLQLVPYAGGPAQAMNDVMSGRVHLILDAYAGLAAALKGDLIKGLADTRWSGCRASRICRPIAETVPDFFVGAWTVLVAPLGTPDPIVRKVNADLWTALNDPDVQDEVPGQRRVPAQDDAGGGHGVRAGASRRPGGRSWSRWRRRRRSERAI